MPRDAEYMNGELPVGTMLLRNQYRIERRLVDGGFGITYLARDSLDRRVVIKECYPSEISSRDGELVIPRSADFEEVFTAIQRQFRYEAQRLAALTHPNIVKVHQIFEENGTSYMAMEFVDGVDLTTITDIEPERFSPEIIRSSLIQALEALSYTHAQGILHRDLAPDNLLLGAREHLTLIDFGSAYDERGDHNGPHTKLLAVKDGFSPHEFYGDHDTQNASSDIYALGASFYYVITGAPPPNGEERHDAIKAGDPDPYQPLVDGSWGCPNKLLALIDRALAVHQQDRIQSADEWLEALHGVEKKVAGVEEAPVSCKIETPVAVVAEAPAPSPVKADLSAPISEEVITQLVTDTNMKLTAGMPGELKKQRQKDLEKQSQEAAAKPKQWVDIFGNPIKDVDAFLREQDGGSRKKSSSKSDHQSVIGSKLLMNIPSTPGDDEQRPTRTSVLGKLLSRGSRSKRRSSKSAIVQT